MGVTSSSTPHPKEDPDLTSSFGTNLQSFKMKTKILSQKLITFIEASLEEGSLWKTVSAISSALTDIEKAPLNFTVIGEVGAGKSSLINALQGVEADEEGAAASTGVVYTATVRTLYINTRFPTVTLWDLSGLGLLPSNHMIICQLQGRREDHQRGCLKKGGPPERLFEGSSFKKPWLCRQSSSSTGASVHKIGLSSLAKQQSPSLKGRAREACELTQLVLSLRTKAYVRGLKLSRHLVA